MPIAKQFEVFLCHDTRDKEQFVRPIAKLLKLKGCRYFLDEETLRDGDRLSSTIEAAIVCSKLLVVVSTKNAISNLREDRWIRKEVAHANKSGVPVRYVFPGDDAEFETFRPRLRELDLDPPPEDVLCTTGTSEKIAEKLLQMSVSLGYKGPAEESLGRNLPLSSLGSILWDWRWLVVPFTFLLLQSFSRYDPDDLIALWIWSLLMGLSPPLFSWILLSSARRYRKTVSRPTRVAPTIHAVLFFFLLFAAQGSSSGEVMDYLTSIGWISSAAIIVLAAAYVVSSTRGSG